MTAPYRLHTAAYPAGIFRVFDRLQAAGCKAYLVGGCIRDILRGAPPKDYDVATDASPQEVLARFIDLKTIETGLKHGTVTVIADGLSIEVTTFRSESDYTDGRRPDAVVFETDINKDLARRDFTVNAIAYDPIHDEMVDPFDGDADILNGIIRAVGSPQARFAEDGLRPLRAVRFATLMGWRIDNATLAAIPGALGTFKKVSIERVVDEFLKILTADGGITHPAGNGLRLLKSTGLLESFLPEVTVNDSHLFDVVARSAPDLCVRLAALFSRREGSAPAALRALKLPTKVVDRTLALLAALRGAAILQDGNARQFRKLCSLHGDAAVVDALGLASIIQQVNLERLVDDLHDNPPLSVRDLTLNGEDIMEALGCKPGREVGEAQKALLDLVLYDPASNTPGALKRALFYWKAGEKLLPPEPFGNLEFEIWRKP